MDVKSLSRRGLLSMVVSAITYLCYRVAAHNSWIVVTRGPKQFDPGACPTSHNTASEISLLVVGDTGLPSSQRDRVVSMMERQAAHCAGDAVVMLGDNFYEKGVQSISDPRFQTDFERLFNRRHFNCPFFPVLGNHDYHGNVLAQVDYTQHSERWRMLGTHYKVRYGVGDSSLDLFMIDTNPIDSATPEAPSQLEWLDRELARSDASWKIVAGHHPCLSGGEHGPSDNVLRELGPLLKRHRVAIYLSGHEHDLQLLDSGQGWLQLISGSGSKLRSTSWIETTEFAAASPGFAWLLIQNGQLAVTIFDDQERLFTRVIPAVPTRQSHPRQSQLAQQDTPVQVDTVCA